MSSSCKNYEEVEPYTDGGGNTYYSGTGYSGHLHRPVLREECKSVPFLREDNIVIIYYERPITPSSSNWREVYPQISNGANPSINSNKGIYYERPITPSHPLNKPTNDIGSAADFLAAGAIKPNYRTNTPAPQAQLPSYQVPIWELETKLITMECQKIQSTKFRGEHPA